MACTPQLRTLFVIQTALVKYRFGLPGFELPDTVYTAYQEVNNLLLQTHHTSNPFATDFTLTAAAVAGGHSAGLLWGLGLLAAVAPLLGVMAILRLRRAA